MVRVFTLTQFVRTMIRELFKILESLFIAGRVVRVCKINTVCANNEFVNCSKYWRVYLLLEGWLGSVKLTQFVRTMN